MLLNKEITKCPCEKCLLIPICRNRNRFPEMNFISSLDKCSLLKDYFKVSRIAKYYTDFDSDLTEKEINKRFQRVDVYLPCGNLHALI